MKEGDNQSVHLKARVMVRGEGIIVLLQWLWELRGSMQREGQAPRPTKSEWDRSSVKFNPHHSWLGLTEQQNLTLFRGEASMMAINYIS